MNLLEALALSLALTEMIEIPVCFLFGFRGRDLIIALLANIVTNPAAVFLIYLLSVFTSLPKWCFTLAIELSVFITEAFIYRKATETKMPTLVSFTANALSYSTGLLFTIFVL